MAANPDTSSSAGLPPAVQLNAQAGLPILGTGQLGITGVLLDAGLPLLLPPGTLAADALPQSNPTYRRLRARGPAPSL